jgi:hypothetical protein
MKTYVSDHADTSATPASLATSIKQASGTDIAPFLQRWTMGTGYPIYTVGLRRSGEGEEPRLAVEVSASGDFALPVTIEIVRPNGMTRRETLPLNSRAGSVELEPGVEVSEVRFDPEHHIAGRWKSAVTGDIHVNGEVDGIDLITMAWAVGGELAARQDGEESDGTVFPEWADLTFDGRIDDTDLNLVADAFGDGAGK